MTPTPEEAKRYGLALAALNDGIAPLWSNQWWLSWRYTLDNPRRESPKHEPKPTPIAALVAAAEVLGLEPVQFPPSVPEGFVLVPVASLKSACALEWAIMRADCRSHEAARPVDKKLYASYAKELRGVIAALSSSPKETPA